MFNTSQFALPLLTEGQAQKHITVNEGLARLDAMAQLRLQSISLKTPPQDVSDGQCYGVPSGAMGDWVDHVGALAIYANGGWDFITPKTGWRAWVVDVSDDYRFMGSSWVLANLKTGMQVLKFSHQMTAGATNETAQKIPANVWVLSITHRVQKAIQTSDNTGWQLGHADNTLYWGSHKDAAQGAAGIGYNSAGMAYFWKETPLLLSLSSGTFTSGKVDFQVYYFALSYPALEDG